MIVAVILIIIDKSILNCITNNARTNITKLIIKLPTNPTISPLSKSSLNNEIVVNKPKKIKAICVQLAKSITNSFVGLFAKLMRTLSQNCVKLIITPSR